MLIRFIKPVLLGLLVCNAAFAQQRVERGVVGAIKDEGETTTTTPAAPASDAKPGEWIQLFNGKDLTGWTPKIRHQPLGENWGNTFRVEDGVLRVVYDDTKAYPKYNEQFGHLFLKNRFRIIVCESSIALWELSVQVDPAGPFATTA